ncbi:MAG: glutathione S-transferase N-terminal domain-containing protein [Pseudomonadota bacterium]
MIDLYTWSTPNGRKVSILLEELELDYRVFPVDITREEQFAPAFLEISPNNKIPAIVDHRTGRRLMESGAILLYLASTHGAFLPADEGSYWRCVEWLMWQMGGFGPMLGQAHHFVHFNPDKSDYAKARYADEARRLYGVLDKRLRDRDYLLGGDYTIADIAIWPWTSRFQWQDIELGDFPQVRRWYLSIAERPAVRRGFKVPNDAEIPRP